MDRHKSFVTGSYNKGTYSTATNSIESYGRFTFPDGSFYQGYFRNGVFHGNGIYELAAPYRIKFRVTHNMSRLTDIEEIVFDDGLHFNCNFQKKVIKTDNWTYLTRFNRFYLIELFMGAQPVEPSSFFTGTSNPPIIPSHKIDVGEGFYNPITRFVKDRRPPLKDKRFVCDDDEVEWIEKHCRVSDDLELVIPSMEDCEKILRLNRKELAIINPDKECPCEADKKPKVDIKNETNFSISSISPSSICDEDVRVSEALVSKTRIRRSLSNAYTVKGKAYQSLIGR